jgi:hypothetical protein
VAGRKVMRMKSVLWLYAVESLLGSELDAAAQFCRFSESRFDREIAKLRKAEKSQPKSYWDEALDHGTSRRDLLEDEFAEVRSMQRMNRYFGVILVYSALERFLFLTFRNAKKDGFVKSSDLASKRFLDFRGYVSLFKNMGIVLSTRTNYAALDKLHKVRTAIMHYGGWVHRDMAAKLKAHNFEEHQRIELEEEYISEIKELVRTECRFIANCYRDIAGVRHTRGTEQCRRT